MSEDIITRRDIAAMRLAYECLRGTRRVGEAYNQAMDVLEMGGADAVLAAALYDRAPSYRLLRARLALLLRVLLRVAAGDYGPSGKWLCLDCGSDNLRICLHGRRGILCVDCESQRKDFFEPVVRPLWESAPPHGGGR